MAESSQQDRISPVFRGPRASGHVSLRWGGASRLSRNAALDGGELRAPGQRVVAGTRQADRLLRDEPARLGAHHGDAIAQQDRLVDVMGHEHDGLAVVAPEIEQLGLQGAPGQRVERGEGLVHEQHGVVG